MMCYLVYWFLPSTSFSTCEQKPEVVPRHQLWQPYPIIFFESIYFLSRFRVLHFSATMSHLSNSQHHTWEMTEHRSCTVFDFSAWKGWAEKGGGGNIRVGVEWDRLGLGRLPFGHLIGIGRRTFSPKCVLLEVRILDQKCGPEWPHTSPYMSLWMQEDENFVS